MGITDVESAISFLLILWLVGIFWIFLTTEKTGKYKDEDDD